MFDLNKLLKVIDPEPVLIDQQACLRARHVRSACRACSDICPGEAFGYANRRLTVDPDRCSRCGLCLGACPTGALQVRGIQEEALDGATKVRCAQARGEGVELPCLGTLSADHLIDLGSRCPGVTLVAGNCDSCALARGGAQAKANLALATETLKALGVTELPRWQTGGCDATAAPAAISRRELLTVWRREAVQTGRSLLPDRQVNPVKLPAKVPARRLKWLKRFQPPAHEERLAWPTRQVAAGCSGCNICVAFCPTGALTSSTESETWTLRFQTAACVDCRTCIDLCIPAVMAAGAPPTVRELLAGMQQPLTRVTKVKHPGNGTLRADMFLKPSRPDGDTPKY